VPLTLRVGLVRRRSSPLSRAGRVRRRSHLTCGLWAVLLALYLIGPSTPGRADAEDPTPPIWNPLAEGIDFTTFYLEGPNRAYVARMNLHQPTVTLDGMVAQGDQPGRREVVSRMARRYEDSLSAWGGTWGERRDVVVAVNGTFFSPATGIPYGAQAHAGWFSFWDFERTGPLNFAWTLDRELLTSQCLVAPPPEQRAVFPASGREMRLTGVDIPLPSNGLVLYTPEYTQRTPAVPGSAVVLVEVSRPVMIQAGGELSLGAIRQVSPEPQSLRLPSDHVALIGHGVAATRLLENAAVGDSLGFNLTLQDRGQGCQQSNGRPWSGVYAGLGGGVFFLMDGAYRAPTDGTEADRHPRTAVCFNEDALHFVVVDGRRPRWSIGMTMAEMAAFCGENLGATWGINLDGGGSSTMWVGGEVINQPSGGEERPVPDGLMMVSLQPALRSFAFVPGDTVRITTLTQFKVGPGWNYPALGEIPADVEGQVVHPLSGLEGILASGAFWWKIDFGEVSGWLPENVLVLANASPTLNHVVLP
jgi:hypothetical protein